MFEVLFVLDVAAEELLFVVDEELLLEPHAESPKTIAATKATANTFFTFFITHPPYLSKMNRNVR